jgi:hypothetical protein
MRQLKRHLWTKSREGPPFRGRCPLAVSANPTVTLLCSRPDSSLLARTDYDVSRRSPRRSLPLSVQPTPIRGSRTSASHSAFVPRSAILLRISEQQVVAAAGSHRPPQPYGPSSDKPPAASVLHSAQPPNLIPSHSPWLLRTPLPPRLASVAGDHQRRGNRQTSISTISQNREVDSDTRAVCRDLPSGNPCPPFPAPLHTTTCRDRNRRDPAAGQVQASTPPTILEGGAVLLATGARRTSPGLLLRRGVQK